ncbi:hypothetical protein [Pseudomonas amygdali]|uniref:Uncharacterized protein n=2 Tax=Pseudomonas amygdali pv. lachrymans TaxID=53707 RepID=A0ABR5KRB1_PSEAV|nr:hypothetical protein [Pseudomonas amygdali]AXH59828.1 hypothetical protein PLA107_031890 [Pseudomonas amygdali pv. lachrymans str. M301315]KPC17246.1 Uncharacterized protein AC499_0448 [Pseudomonas amygdali pv. lachrymans]KPC18205.1 Uncharacterized protein AC499_1407 [Pseudomonas amygdali pv. lachrymans]RMT06281.1 hypothetical protein ALP54_03713 [Pseudomonas amygdali pv. lachrymans]
MRNSDQHRKLMYDFEYMGKPKIYQLAHIDKKLGNKAEGTTQGLTQENFLKLHDVAKRAQMLILDYKLLHGDLEHLRSDVIEHMAINHNSEKDIAPRVMAYALVAGTSKLTSVLQLLHDELGPQDLLDVKQAYQDECLKHLQGYDAAGFQDPLPVKFILENGVAAYKTFYPNKPEPTAYQFVEKALSGELPQAGVMHLLDMLKEEDKTGEKWTQGFMRYAQYILGQRPYLPNANLRLALTGTQIPSNRECSQRLSNAIRSIMSSTGLSAHEGTLEEFAETIRLNDFYYEKLLLQDLTSSLMEEVQSSEQNPDQDFDHGVEAWMRLSVFLKALKLSDEELSVIALRSVREASLGSAYDDALENPAIGALSMSQLLFTKKESIRERIEKEPARSIAFGIWHSMSQFAMGQALQTDEGRFVMYKITNNRLLLNGLKDKSLVDQAFGADLGL